MDVDPMTITELSSSPYGFGKSLPRRKSLSEFDPSLGNEIQNLLKAAERNSAVAPDLARAMALRDQLPVFSKLAFETSQHSTEQRKRNITEGIEWLRTQLKSMKEQDKSLMRQFLDLRASINQFKEDIDPYDDLSDQRPKRTMSMLDHLNDEKRLSRFALARRLIEDIHTLDELTDSDEECTAEESGMDDDILPRGRPITPSVSIAADHVRPHTFMSRDKPISTNKRPVSDSAKYEKDGLVTSRRVRSVIWPPQIRPQNITTECEDTRL